MGNGIRDISSGKGYQYVTHNIEQTKEEIKQEYNFYRRVLRVIYKKKSLRKKTIIMITMLENTSYTPMGGNMYLVQIGT